jgi:WD40 repeat protein/tRNA A-37 threonylcarbamoyl transferase component Bud32
MDLPTSSDNRLVATRVEREFDEACDRFEAAWRAGDRPLIEDYLGGLTASGRPVLLRHLLDLELAYRERFGESPGPAEYRLRFPGNEELVGSIFAAFVHRTNVVHGGDSETLEWTRRHGARPATQTRPMPDDLRNLPGVEILSELGRGGMGVVYKARQIRLNRLCALKISLPGERDGALFRARFLAEAETIAKLKHPNIVQIYDLGEHDGRPYFQMEFIEGGSLARRLDGTPWPPERAARMVLLLARAIGEAHRLGIVHRDLKPANVLLLDDDTPKVADFGLAKSLGGDSSLTQSGVFVGTPSYAAPEQAESSTRVVGPAVDIYALGAIFYHMLTGRPPFRAATVLETLEQVRTIEPVAPSRLQPGLARDAETICLKCLEKDPERRYADAAALAEDLDRYLAGRPILARPTGLVERLGKWIWRRPAVALLSGALVAVALVGFIMVVWQWRRAEAKAAACAAACAAAQHARLVAFQKQAELTFHQGQALCDQGEVGRGLLWLGRSLELCAEAQSAGLDRPIRINLADWASQLGRLRRLRPMRHSRPIRGLEFRRGDHALVSVDEDGLTRIWDTTTGNEVNQAHNGRCDPRGTRTERAGFRGGEGGRPGAVDHARPANRCDMATKGPLSPESQLEKPVVAFAITPDGRKVIRGKGGGRLHVWDAASERAFDLPAQGTEVTSLAVSSDGRVFASGTKGGVVRLWDTCLLGQIGQTCKFAGGVTALAFDPDGRELAIGDDDGGIRLWEVPRPKALGFPLRVNHPVQSLTFGADGRRLLIGTTDGARWWDLNGRSVCESDQARDDRYDHGPSSRVEATAISPDRRTVATARSVLAEGGTRGRLELRDPATGKLLRQIIESPHPLLGAVYSPDSKWILAWGPDPGTARLWDVATLRKSRRLFRSLESPVRQAVFSGDGRIVLLGCRDGKARLWDLERDVEIDPARRPRHAYPITAVAFDPTRSRVLTGCHAGTVRIWDAVRGTMLNELRQNAGEIVVLAFSPDGEMLVTASDDGAARFVDARSGAQLGPALHHTDAVFCVAFAPDGKSVVTGTRDGLVQRFSVPSPAAAGGVAEIGQWLKQQTGMELDDQGAVTISTICK